MLASGSVSLSFNVTIANLLLCWTSWGVCMTAESANTNAGKYHVRQNEKLVERSPNMVYWLLMPFIILVLFQVTDRWVWWPVCSCAPMVRPLKLRLLTVQSPDIIVNTKRWELQDPLIDYILYWNMAFRFMLWWCHVHVFVYRVTPLAQTPLPVSLLGHVALNTVVS